MIYIGNKKFLVHSVPDRPGRPAVGPVACRPGQMRLLDFRNCVGQANDLKAGSKSVGDWVNCGLLSAVI